MSDELIVSINALKETMQDGFARIERKIDKMEEVSIDNGKELTEHKVKLDTMNEALMRNFEQHKDFYSVDDRLTKLETKVNVSIALLSVLFSAAIAVIEIFVK